MPWRVRKNYGKCGGDKPFAVVKESDGSVAGCHATRSEAVDQLRALYVSEPDSAARTEEDTALSVLAEPQNLLQDENGATVDTTAAAETVAAPPEVKWKGVLCVEDVETGDGRMFAGNALSWPDLPIPLMYQKVTSHGGSTDVSVNVGRIDNIYRHDGKIYGEGVIDLSTDDGIEAAGKIRGKYLRGVSIDADSVTDDDVEFIYPEMPGEDATEEELLQALFARPTLTIFHAARIRGTTLVNVPAFVEASIDLIEDDVPVTASAVVIESEDCGCTTSTSSEPLVAAGHTITIPDLPDGSWFEEPDALPPIGAVWVDDDGHFFGLVGPSDVAHRAFKDRKVTIPMGRVDYTRWMNRPTIVRGGDRVATGVVTMNCGHESPYASSDAYERMKHYDNSCSIAATARVGESTKWKAPWVAGGLLPMSASDFRRFMGCQLSGDWGVLRERPGWQELAAVLAVPVPGFARSTKTARVRVENGVIVASSVPIMHISEMPAPKARQFRRELEQIMMAVTPVAASVNHRHELGALRDRLIVR